MGQIGVNIWVTFSICSLNSCVCSEAIEGGPEGQLLQDTFTIRESDFVVYKVIVRKDTRMLELTQIVQVVEGDPPDIRIE